MTLTVVCAIASFLLAVVLTSLVLHSRSAATARKLAECEATIAARDAELMETRNARTACEVALKERAEQLDNVTTLRHEAEKQLEGLKVKLEEQELAHERQLADLGKHMQEKLQLVENMRDQLPAQFKALANDILEEKSKRFTEQNQVNLSQLLTPLSEKIKNFQQKVEEVYVQEGKDRSALSEQVKMLYEMNQKLSDGTLQLTRALTSQAKVQGDLGEMILEKILEASGLRKDEEYTVQNSFRNDENRQSRPDVIIRLPENKHLIIDSKVSLTAYNEYVNAENEEAHRAALERHLVSVRQHIKELAEKNYQDLTQIQSIDFVCMFVPIEGAFLLAISSDQELWTSAYARNVLLVSPSTLLFVVRTVAHLWNQERQRQSVADVMKRGAELYDKLVGFVDDLKGVGDRLKQAQDSYDSAFSKLSTGKGNAIRQAEMLKEMGVKPKKNLPQDLVEASSPAGTLLLEENSNQG